MNKKLFSTILSIFLLIPSFSYAICEGNIVPCGQDLDGDGEIEWEVNKDGQKQDFDGDGHYDLEICQFCHIFELANNIIVYLMTCLAPIVSGVMLILGGFYFMIAGVDPGKMQTAKNIVTAAIVGLVVMFIAWILLNTFLSSMGIATWTGLDSWWEFKCE